MKEVQGDRVLLPLLLLSVLSLMVVDCCAALSFRAGARLLRSWGRRPTFCLQQQTGELVMADLKCVHSSVSTSVSVEPLASAGVIGFSSPSV
jgi:hypothetical protein